MKTRITATVTLATALFALSACASTGNDKVADATPPPSMEPRGDKPMRVIKPGMAVTMDYRPDRLNVQVGEDGKISKFTCT
jgi:hypothetical protein